MLLESEPVNAARMHYKNKNHYYGGWIHVHKK